MGVDVCIHTYICIYICVNMYIYICRYTHIYICFVCNKF